LPNFSKKVEDYMSAHGLLEARTYTEVPQLTPAAAVVRGFINLTDYVFILMKRSFL